MSDQEEGFVEKELRLKEGLEKGDYSPPGGPRMGPTAGEIPPIKTWLRIRRLDAAAGDQLPWERTSEAEK